MEHLLLAAGGLDALLDGVLDVVILALSAAISAAIVGVARKYGLELDRKKTQRAVREVLNFVEEKSKLSEKLGRKLPSDEKMKMATTKLVDRVPGISQKEAEYLVTSHLREVGLGAAGGFLAGIVEATDGDDEAPTGE